MPEDLGSMGYDGVEGLDASLGAVSSIVLPCAMRKTWVILDSHKGIGLSIDLLA